MPSLTETTFSVLRRAGWTPERRADTAHWERLIASSGQVCPPRLLEFLARFGGLTLQIRDPLGRLDHVVLDPTVGFERIPSDELPEWKDDAGRQVLIPIGEAFSAHTTLVATEGDEVLGIYDHVMVIGRSFEEALNNLVADRTKVNWPSIDEL